jgi:hypothetical protein
MSLRAVKFVRHNPPPASLRATNGSVAIHHLVIAGLSAITLNVFFETAHLYRRSIFCFVRIKREDLFEVIVLFFYKKIKQ